MGDGRPNRLPHDEELFNAALGRESADIGNCPTPDQLTSLAGGSYDPQDPAFPHIKMHVSRCNHCLARLKEIRPPSAEPKLETRFLTLKPLVPLAAILVLLIGLWIYRTPGRAVVATVDLRETARSADASPLLLRGDATSIRVVLPIGSATGVYDLGIFVPAGRFTPILTASGSTILEDGNLVVSTSLPLKRLQAGSYLFGIRPPGQADWIQYEITINP
jgi:hypothetical protein